jgi:type IV pilus assembly protein PilQ
MMGWKRVSLPLLVVLGLSCAGNPPPSDPAQDVAFFPETITITGLEATDTGEATDVVVKGNFPFNYSSFEPDPSRLVIEVPGAEADALEDVIAISTDEVNEVLVSTEEYPGGSRIARLEFTGLTSVRHDLFLEGNHLRIRFFGSDTEVAETETWDSTGWELQPEDGDWIASDESDPFDETQDSEFMDMDGLESDSDDDLPWLTELEDQEGAEPESDGMDLEPAEPEDEFEPMPEPMPAAEPAAALLNIQSDGPQDVTTVHLVADGRLEYRDFQLENPDRAVVDLVGITNRVPFRALTVETESLKQVRVAQFQTNPEKITRVVFDMNTPREYVIEDTPEGVQIRFASADGFPPVEEPVLIADNGNDPEVDAVAIPPLLAEVGPDADIDMNLNDPSDSIDPAEEIHVPLNPVDEDLPPGFEMDGVEQVDDPDAGMEEFPVMEEEIDNTDAMGNTDTQTPDVTTDLAAEVEEMLLGDDATMILKAATDPYTAREISGTAALYTGPRISLDFKDADIKDVFRLFHEILGYNIVLDPGVGGKLTIVLDEVPADQALDIILKNNGLDKVFENNVIRVATTQKLAQEAAARRQLMEAKELEQEPLTFARKLSYAKADDVVRLLREAGGGSSSGGILSRKGNARFDERTNTLIITDIPKNMEGINRLVDLLDEETPQVMIEARIVETDRDFERDFGISWGWQVDLDPAIGLSFGNIRDSWDLNFTLEAFELNGDVKILSSPRIATQNNETAVIEQGTQIPVVNTTATEINVEFISASLRLEVTPQITKDDTIIMEVMVDNSSPDFVNRVGDVPPIITERAETLILVENGGTAVIGGIFKLDEAFSEVGVPGLKNIPLLGWLFKNRSVTRGNTELLIFLTPRILERG